MSPRHRGLNTEDQVNMADDLPKISFIPFSGKPTDWHIWRTQFSSMNIGTGVNDLLLDNYVKPETLDPGTRKRSQLLYRNLIVCMRNAGIAQSIILRTDYAETFDGIGAWQALCKKFERSTKSNRINDILRSFHPSNYNLDMDPEAYLHQLISLKTMALHCGSKYKEVINDLLITNKIMDEFEGHYPYQVASFNVYMANQERVAIINNSEPDIDIYELVESASREYNNRLQRKGRYDRQNVPTVAFSAQQATYNSVITCMWCGLHGHYAAQCRKKDRDLRTAGNRPSMNNHNGKNKKGTNLNTRNNNRNKIINNGSCIICKSSNHSTRDCNKIHKKEKSQLELMDTNASINMAISSGPSKNYDRWIVDSGSTYHVTPYFKEIKNPIEVEIDIQSVGKTVKSTHMGDVDLQTANKKGEYENITLEDVLYVPETEHRLISTEALIFKKQASIDMTPGGRYLSLVWSNNSVGAGGATASILIGANALDTMDLANSS